MTRYARPMDERSSGGRAGVAGWLSPRSRLFLAVVVLPAIAIAWATSRSVGVAYAIVAAVGMAIAYSDVAEAADSRDRLPHDLPG